MNLVNPNKSELIRTFNPNESGQSESIRTCNPNESGQSEWIRINPNFQSEWIWSIWISSKFQSEWIRSIRINTYDSEKFGFVLIYRIDRIHSDWKFELIQIDQIHLDWKLGFWLIRIDSDRPDSFGLILNGPRIDSDWRLTSD